MTRATTQRRPAEEEKKRDRRTALPALFWGALFLIGFLLATAGVPAASADDIDLARRIHDRLVGIPPDDATLATMVMHIGNGDVDLAADVAMQNPVFYTTYLKNWITPWTNEDQTVFAPLNDYTATVIGMIRDDVPFNEVLSADVVYVGTGASGEPNYSQTDNLHYEFLEANNVDLSDPALFEQRTQSGLPGSQMAAADTAGIMTTRAAGEAFFSGGTNRAMFRFTSMNYLCRDLEDLLDITRPGDRIRQDVSRSPGGDSEIYLTTCFGCHAGMDPLAGAFAYFEWDDAATRVVHTPGNVQPKYLINANTFPFGYVTIDNRWDNYWRNGPNSSMGWRAAASGGYGPKSMGAELASSQAFSTCQVEKVFQHVCFRPPNSQADRDAINAIITEWEANDYNLKLVFARVAEHCMAD